MVIRALTLSILTFKKSLVSRAYDLPVSKSGFTVFPEMETGFTLIEVLVVSILIGILATVSIPSYMRWIDQTKYAYAKTQMNCTAKNLQIYKLEKGHYPADVWTNAKPTGIDCFYLKSSKQIPFDSVYDYEKWTASGGKCFIQVTFYGKDGIRQSPNFYQSQYASIGFYEDIPEIGDDILLSLGIQDCD